MIRNIGVLISLLFTFTTVFGQEGDYKVFPFKSAIVKYKLDGNSKGIHTKYIDKYGFNQADYTEVTTKFMGISSSEESATIMKGSEVYAVNFTENTATKQNNPLYQMYANSSDADYDQLGRQGLESLGYHNTGEQESILGKACEIWSGSMGRIWIWKSLALKSETKIMGMTMMEVATELDLDIKVPADKFKVPKNIKVQDNPAANDFGALFGGESPDLTDEDEADIDKVSNLSYKEFRQMMLREDPNSSEEEIQTAYDMVQLMKRKK